MATLISSLLLATSQLGDRRILRVLGKSVLVSLALFGLLGWLGWTALDWGLARAGIADGRFFGAAGLRGVASLVGVVLGGWLLWRVVALGVIQFYADEVVAAIEARYYPDAAASARSLEWREELAVGWRGAIRAVVANLVALPFAVALLVTGIGTALLFWVVNAVLLGRELTDMVWLRHAHAPGEAAPISRVERFMLGGVIAALLLVPFVNLLSPILGAASATHLIHRKKGSAHAA
jgi:CysZ protein